MGITTSSLTHRSPASEKREGQSLGGPVISSFDTYTTHWLADDAPAEMRTKARAFCLRIIKEFYDIGYTPAWHADLDSMSGAKSRNWFSTERGGGFLLVRDGRGAIAGAGGLYGLINKPLTADRLRDRYRDPTHVCQIVRVYLDPLVRGKGLGTAMVEALETEARNLGYVTSYLHAEAQTPNTLSFWKSRGYREFGHFSYPSPNGIDTSVYFEKPLNAISDD